MGTLVVCSSSTISMILLRNVSLPTFSARTCSSPLWFIVAPITWSPTAFFTGFDSPVAMLSSTVLSPLVTTPSVGIFSPGLTSITSPSRSSSAGMVVSWLSRSTLAVVASRANSSLIAWFAFPFARASR